MKRQYLGDAKDSFKWDYHHFLVETLGYSHLKIAWMMTPDDTGTHGRTNPELYPAREEILGLCKELRETRNPTLLLTLPERTNAQFSVNFHTPNEYDNNIKGATFFSDIQVGAREVLFLDPDNGFEPERSATEKHLRYSDLDKIIKTISADTVITVFQHHRRKKFQDDFASIRKRVLSGHCCAIYWQSLMFVILSSSAETLVKVSDINRKYAQLHPVKLLD